MYYIRHKDTIGSGLWAVIVVIFTQHYLIQSRSSCTLVASTWVMFIGFRWVCGCACPRWFRPAAVHFEIWSSTHVAIRVSRNVGFTFANIQRRYDLLKCIPISRVQLPPASRIETLPKVCTSKTTPQDGWISHCVYRRQGRNIGGVVIDTPQRALALAASRQLHLEERFD